MSEVETLLVAARYSLLAEAGPGLLSRLLQPFAKRDLTPDLFRAVREGDALRVEIALHAMPAEMVHLAEGNLRQVMGVLELRVTQEQSARLAA